MAAFVLVFLGGLLAIWPAAAPARHSTVSRIPRFAKTSWCGHGPDCRVAVGDVRAFLDRKQHGRTIDRKARRQAYRRRSRHSVRAVARVASAGTYTETTGSEAHTWTNYTNAGGYEGPTIPIYDTVQIACRVQGFRVADGNTWWYLIASSPWNYDYYVSADPFYNNGETSGSLIGTPFVDPNVPECGSGGGTAETAGSEAHTWSDYADAGGTEGPTIGGGATVDMACKVTGFRVADGNTWWYRISQAPWNNAYYVSADAFYNNGETSGSLLGTPFVDPNVPTCSEPSGSPGHSETTGSEAHTWTNYSNAGGSEGPTIPGNDTIQIECKATGFAVADGNTWWYKIESAPWSGTYYVSADAFYNNGETSGSLLGTPFVDQAVPDCAEGARPPGETTGSAAETWSNYSHAGGEKGPTIPAYTTVSVSCRVQGFAVADGNTWWYLVSSSPWNNVYYVSADAFYNDGATSGTLIGTPFVDTGVPVCVGNHEAPIGTAVGSSHAVTHSTGCVAGDPVDCASGDFWQTFTDVSIAGRGPGLKLTRTYNSLNADKAGIFGYGWSSSLDQHLTFTEDGTIVITLDDGSEVPASPNGSGGFTLPSSADATLVENGGGTYTLTRHATESLTFSSAGKLSAIGDPNGYETTLSYNGSGQLATVTDTSGRTLTITFGSNGFVSSVTDPLGRTTTYSYNSGGDLESVTDPMGRTWSFSYDESHRMVKMTDPRGGIVSNTYGSESRVVSQTDPAGLTTTFAYTGDNFSSLGGTTTITDPQGSVTIEQYANGFMTEVTKAAGTAAQATWTYAYEPNTLGTISTTDPKGNIETDSYNETGQLLSSTDPEGMTTSYTYNAMQELVTTTTPLGRTTTRAYDAQGNLTSITDADGDVTNYEYGDASYSGDLTAIVDPEGWTEHLSYDTYGDVASRTVSPLSGVNDTTSYAYDADGELLCEASADPTAAGVSCPAAGGARIARTTTKTYNADGEETSVTTPTGEKTSYTYDEDGNRTQTTDPRGNVTTATYDPDNRVTAQTTGANGPSPSTTHYAYDLAPGTGVCQAVANTAYCSTTVNGDGGTTISYYDAREDVIETARPGGQTTRYGYDADGNKTSATDASGRTTTYGYDPDNRLIAITYSDGITPDVEYSYDADGDRTSMHDGTGTITYAYDPDGRLKSVTDGAGVTTSYEYNKAGDITSLTYPNGKAVTRSYDGAGRLASVTDWLGHTTSFAYDADGNLTSTTYPNGDTVKASYNASNAVTNTSLSDGTKILASIGYARDEDELVTRETAQKLKGSSTDAYNSQNELDAAGTSSFSYDPAGNVTGDEGVKQEYNAESELTEAVVKSEPTAYSYDPEGDRTLAKPAKGLITHYRYDEAGRLVGVSETNQLPKVTHLKPTSGPASGGTVVKITGEDLGEATAVSFGPNAATDVKVISAKSITATAPAGEGTVDVQVTTPAGTSAAVTADQFTYAGEDDALDGVRRESLAAKAAPAPPPPTSYAYNGDGLRMSETTAGTTTQFTWDTTPSTPEIIGDANNYYVYGPGGLPIEQISHAESPSYYFHDALGSTRALLGPTGAITATYTYAAYGTVKKVTGSVTTPLEYAQGYTDATTGLVYLVHRYYDPRTGQFLSLDPAAEVTQSPYTYANGDPSNLNDPAGLWAVGLCVGVEATLKLGVSVTVSADLCDWAGGNGLWASWNAVTLTVTGGVGVGAGTGAGLSVGAVWNTGAKDPEELAGKGCSVGGSVAAAAGISASVDCSKGLKDGGIFASLGGQIDVSIERDIGWTVVLWASNGYSGWGSSGGPPAASAPSSPGASGPGSPGGGSSSRGASPSPSSC
jgi:RHS repeat-associated protein